MEGNQESFVFNRVVVVAPGVLWDGLQGGNRVQRLKGSQLLMQCWVKECCFSAQTYWECKKEVKFMSAQFSPKGDK